LLQKISCPHSAGHKDPWRTVSVIHSHLGLQPKEELGAGTGDSSVWSIEKARCLGTTDDRGQPTGRTFLGPSQEKWTPTLEQTPTSRSGESLGKPWTFLEITLCST